MNVQKIKVCLWGSMQWRLNKRKVPRRPRRVTGKAKKSVRVKKNLFSVTNVLPVPQTGAAVRVNLSPPLQ